MVVKRMPQRLNLKMARDFLKEVKPILNSDRPQVVFDLSQVQHIDAAGVDMLLHCMAEAMKRDGDLKLSGLSPQAAVVLELTRTDRLFEIYESSTDAVRSFSSFLPNALRSMYPASHPAAHSVPFPRPLIGADGDGAISGDGADAAA